MSSNNKVIIATVGLPHMGNNIIAQKLKYYLEWLGNNTKLFESCPLSGNFMNSMINKINTGLPTTNITLSFLNDKEKSKRDMNDIRRWFDSQKDGIVIYNATNHLSEIRKIIFDSACEINCSIIFIETQNNNPDRKNIYPRIIKLINDNEAGDSTEKDIYSVFDQIEKDLSAYYEHIRENEHIPHVSFLHQHQGSEIYTNEKLLPHIIDVVLQYLYRLNLTPGSIYMTWHDFSQNNPLTELSTEGNIFADNLNKKLSGKEIRIYAATEKYNVDIFETIIRNRKPIKTNHNLDHGFYLLKALDEKDLRIKLNNLTHQESLDKFLNNSVAKDYMAEKNLCTDTMPRHIIELIMLEATRRASINSDYQFTLHEETELNLRKRLSSVLIELESHSEDMLVIASKPIITNLLNYFSELDLKGISNNALIKLSPSSKEKYESEIINL